MYMTICGVDCVLFMKMTASLTDLSVAGMVMTRIPIPVVLSVIENNYEYMYRYCKCASVKP